MYIWAAQALCCCDALSLCARTLPVRSGPVWRMRARAFRTEFGWLQRDRRRTDSPQPWVKALILCSTRLFEGRDARTSWISAWCYYKERRVSARRPFGRAAPRHTYVMFSGRMMICNGLSRCDGERRRFMLHIIWYIGHQRYTSIT